MNNNEKATMKIDSHKLKQLRLEKSWSQEKLATRADLNLRTVQRIESEGYASLRSMEALAEALESEPAELITGMSIVDAQSNAGYVNNRYLWLMLSVVAVIVGSLFLAGLCSPDGNVIARDSYDQLFSPVFYFFTGNRNPVPAGKISAYILCQHYCRRVPLCAITFGKPDYHDVNRCGNDRSQQ